MVRIGERTWIVYTKLRSAFEKPAAMMLSYTKAFAVRYFYAFLHRLLVLPVSWSFTFLSLFFKGYLFGESNGGLSKYQRIVNILKETYQEYPGYQLYVCGHSLGGALAILLAFTLAATQDVPESPQPIKTITFACPPVGDKGYGRAFEVSHNYCLRCSRFRLLRMNCNSC